MGEELKEFLASHFDHVREWTLMSCRELSDELLVFIPAGAKNHILWELGHILWTQNYMITWGCAGGKRLPKEWEEKFGYGSKILTSIHQYPSFAEIKTELENGRDAIKNYIRSLSFEELKSPPINFPKGSVPDKFYAFSHFISHEAYHVGKISLLRRILGLRSVAELYLEK
jgi:hypothetical protein